MIGFGPGVEGDPSRDVRIRVGDESNPDVGEIMGVRRGGFEVSEAVGEVLAKLECDVSSRIRFEELHDDCIAAERVGKRDFDSVVDGEKY